MLFEHKIIHNIFCFIGMSILSKFIYKYESKKGIYILSGKKTKEEEYYNTKKIFIIALIIIFVWIITELLTYIFIGFLKDLDFWMFELIIMYLFYAKLFNIKIYRHQIFAFLLNIIPCILKIITIILAYNKSLEEDVREIKYLTHKWLIPVGIIVYIILLILNSYAITKIKWLMDIKNFSPIKIFVIYGIVGAIFYIIICILSTFVKCPSSFTNSVCNIIYNDSSYFENFNKYFKKFKGKPFEIIIEFIVNLLGASFF